MTTGTPGQPAAPGVSLSARPVLARKARVRVDHVSGDTLLLYPERGLKLNATGAAVVQLCTGALTVAEIAAQLTAAHGGDPAQILAEVQAFLAALAARGLLGGMEP
jgi:pyrroloquinoline quinone biosynthesis protein D